MNIDSVSTELDNMNIDIVNTKSDNMNIDCAITDSDNINADGIKTESMSPSKLEISPPEVSDVFKKLPLEIITKIILQLDFDDILSLKSVSKIWRCVYINQNVVWASICEDLNILEIEYNRCLHDKSRHDSECIGYAEAASEKLFGPLCHYWLIFNHYIMIINNIKNNDFPTIYIPRKHVEQSYCTDDYIVNINCYHKQPIQIVFLNGINKPIKKKKLRIFDKFRELVRLRKYPIKVIGNKKYLILEICSIIFVYSIFKMYLKPEFFKVIQRSVDSSLNINNFNPEFLEFLNDHCDTKLDLFDHNLAMVHPDINTVFLTDLKTEKTFKELEFTKRPCIVDNMKFSDYRLMVGITKTKKNLKIEHLAIIYHLTGYTQNNKLKIPLFGPVSQFKVTSNCIGVENSDLATPFIIKQKFNYNVFWLECDTFSFDCTRKSIYYNVNKSIFKYDLFKSMLSKFEVTQKIAINGISNHLSLTRLNDRYLLVQSNYPNSYDIFDVKERASVRSIQLTAGYSLVHVGKLSIMFSNNKEFMVVAFN